MPISNIFTYDKINTTLEPVIETPCEKKDVPTLKTIPFKKKFVANALKYSGKLATNIFDNIGDKATSKFLRKHSYEIGSFLDSISDSFQAELTNFMRFELGLPMHVARTLAWTITNFIL